MGKTVRDKHPPMVKNFKQHGQIFSDLFVMTT